MLIDFEDVLDVLIYTRSKTLKSQKMIEKLMQWPSNYELESDDNENS